MKAKGVGTSEGFWPDVIAEFKSAGKLTCHALCLCEK